MIEFEFYAADPRGLEIPPCEHRWEKRYRWFTNPLNGVKRTEIWGTCKLCGVYRKLGDEYD